MDLILYMPSDIKARSKPKPKSTAASKSKSKNNTKDNTTESKNSIKSPLQSRAKQATWNEHVKKRSMWAGSKNTQDLDTYVLGNDKNEDNEDIKVFKVESLKYPPALLKIIDEILVNAVDHYIKNKTKVSKISVNLDSSGLISVFNNGPGIPVEKTKNNNGVEMYEPQFCFTEFLTGTNLDDEEEVERTTGGQNGVGSKLTGVFSKTFIVETTDEKNKLFYKQEFNDGLKTICEPTIISISNGSTITGAPYPKKLSSEQKIGHCRITFMPDYAEFKLKIKDFFPTLYKVIEARVWQAAAYICGGPVKVYFNDTPIQLESFSDFCQMFTEYAVFTTKMTNSEDSEKFPWDICVGITDGKERQISIVNGVFINAGGNHIKHIQNHLVEGLRTRIEKELKKYKVIFNKNLLLNNIFIFMRGAIPNPEFLSQTKDAISSPISKFANYTIPDSHWTKIWNLVQPAVMDTFLKKQIGEYKKRANRGKVDVPKYREAKYCRDAKKCHECGLIITEGDSATGTAHKGLTKKASTKFTYDYFGVYGIQGVMVNCLKESIDKGKKRQSGKLTKKEISFILGKRNPNKKVFGNKRITDLMLVLGLDFNKTYDFTDEGEKEWKMLRYGYILGLTDQDLDGYNIFGLLATFFMVFWPNLIKRGFIRRINTPVIRAYPKKSKMKQHNVKEFFSEKQAVVWKQEVGEDFIQENYQTPFKFFKGLAGHRDKFGEVVQMFKNIDDKICTYILDETAIKEMIIHYGEDTSLRKIALATPVLDEIPENLEIPLSLQYNINTKLFQRDNIIRKLLHNIDGFVSSRRKVFYTLRKHIGHKEIRVVALAGEVMSKANYHHGDASISQTIIRMAQAFPYARNLPLLLPLGEFGSLENGFKKSGAPRYIDTCLNYRLADKLFRKEDDFILDYEVEEGERYEPKFYAPIIPYVLCENNDIPATGWVICVYARDLTAIFKNTRDLINGKITRCKKLPIWMKDFKGEIRKVTEVVKTTNKEVVKHYFVGDYSYDEKENLIHIKELPPGTYSEAYLKGSDETIKKKTASEKKGIEAKEWVEDTCDETNENGVDIKIWLKPGAFEYIDEHYSKNESFDCFEEYFELKEPIHDHINLVDDKGNVIEYKSYEQVFDDWFNYRKDLYAVRIDREIILNDLEIKMLQNMQRFSKEHDGYGITKKTSIEKAIEIISEKKYEIFNRSLLENPKYSTVEELVLQVTSADYGANYNYLLDLSYKDLTEGAYQKRDKRIEELKQRQMYLRDEDGSPQKELFKGARMWLKELDELEDAIKKGMASDWFYGENQFTFDNDDDTSEEPTKKSKTKGKRSKAKPKSKK